MQGAPIPEELGYCDVVSVDEIGSTKVTIFRQDTEDSGISTIIVRASTQNLVDDIERAIGSFAHFVSVFYSCMNVHLILCYQTMASMSTRRW